VYKRQTLRSMKIRFNFLLNVEISLYTQGISIVDMLLKIKKDIHN